MSQETTKETSQYIDNKSFDADLQIAGVLPVGYDGSVLRKEQSKLVAKKITIDGDDTYVATAPIGSDYADAVWQCKKITISGSDIIITWADGDAGFNNEATDLTALNYS